MYTFLWFESSEEKNLRKEGVGILFSFIKRSVGVYQLSGL